MGVSRSIYRYGGPGRHRLGWESKYTRWYKKRDHRMKHIVFGLSQAARLDFIGQISDRELCAAVRAMFGCYVGICVVSACGVSPLL